tara:strand:+ start:81 stop:485 length:405 start_codon:yes stop_codon:yes gene_type:complete
MTKQNLKSEFKVLGQSIPTLTILYGLFLIIWGVSISFLSESKSITSYFPSILGLPLFVSGLLASIKPEKRKLWMHIAVTFGLLCAIGGTRFFMKMSDGINYATLSMLMLFLSGSLFTVICIFSFIHARKARENS